MAPEAIQSPNSVDARSDLYAVGALGYFLLTGQTVFEAETIIQLCQKHIDGVPVPPSQRTSQKISPQLEEILLSCLDKVRSRRPESARVLSRLLKQIPTESGWTDEDAEAWWDAHSSGVKFRNDPHQQAHRQRPAPSTDAAYGHTVVDQSILNDPH